MTVVASKYPLRKNDLYETEAWAVDALVRACPKIKRKSVYEPAAGNHAIVDALEKFGVRTCTSDIATYKRVHDFDADFLTDDLAMRAGAQCEWIITNPPYGIQNRLAVKFVERALQVPNVCIAMLLTAKFDFGSTRRHLFADNDRFAAKVALIDRVSWVGNGKGGTEDHAWYVWNWNNAGNAPSMYWEGKQ